MKDKKLIGPITQLLSMDQLPMKGALKDSQLPIHKHAGILLDGDKIVEIGDFEILRKKIDLQEVRRIDLSENYVALPGMIDCHTHICFAGSRAKDFALRNSGKSYLEIAESGGGIWDTVTQTRKMTGSELAKITASRADQLLENGITTIEVKSGYGLSVLEEIKMLTSIHQANRKTKADLISTCLAAHLLPKDFEGDETAYLDWMVQKLLPIIYKEGLSKRVDIFIEKSAFSKEQALVYLKKAKEIGFQITVHADQFTSGGSEVAVKMQALSADHLEASSEEDLKRLAKSDTIGVALPGASIGLGCPFTPARKLLDMGGALAIASDWNPGSAPMGDLLTQASILATFEKLSTAEVFAGITFRAAAALGLTNKGTIAAGQFADFILFPTSDYQEILYHQGNIKPAQVWKSGLKVFDRKKKMKS